MRYLWTRPLPWAVMATGTSRRNRRETTRSDGSNPQLQRGWTTIRRTTIAAERRWWLALAVVAGLFAMHGLGMHGAHSGDASSTMHSSSISSAPDTPALEMSAQEMPAAKHNGVADIAGLLAADAGAAHLGSAKDRSTDPSGGAGLLGLCLALLALGVLWLRRRPSRQPAWTVPRRKLEAHLARLSVTARGLSPPLRAELSIWRC